jgi:tetraacyldisaccharide 4'-kinase
MPLTAGFRLGVAVRRAAYRRGWLQTRRLGQPVVSVGNLTTGGTGKTPLVAYIARRLLAHGFRPGILTRGYGRRSGADLIALGRDRQKNVNPREVGDEPALLAKMLPEVPIVVCADRFRSGRLAEERFDVNIHLLDDGFQHWALQRDVDIVTLDVTQPLSDQELLPAGRQREPCAALERAHMVVLTRTELGDPQPVEEGVRRINPHAAMFRSRTRLHELVDVATRRSCPPGAFEGERVVALCATGNPAAFFADVRKWGYLVAAEYSFRDHHVYRDEDLLPIMQKAAKSGARALVTTEKDAMNLLSFKGGEPPILACATEIELDEAEQFENALLDKLAACRKN